MRKLRSAKKAPSEMSEIRNRRPMREAPIRLL
jgi:hypothetical protein